MRCNWWQASSHYLGPFLYLVLWEPFTVWKLVLSLAIGHFQFYLWGLIFRNCPWNWSSYEYLTRSSGTDLIIEFILIILRAPDISDSHYCTKKLNHLQLWSASKHSQHLSHEIDFSFTNNVGFLKYLEIWKGLPKTSFLALLTKWAPQAGLHILRRRTRSRKWCRNFLYLSLYFSAPLFA